MKFPRLRNKVLRTIGIFPRRPPTCELHVAFKIPYIYEFHSAGNKQHSSKITRMQLLAT